MKSNLLKAKIIERGFTISELSNKISISPVTFYRKMSGKSEFDRSEITAISDKLSLSSEDIIDIFFS